MATFLRYFDPDTLHKPLERFGLAVYHFFTCQWNTGPEGWRLRQRHFETVTSLVRSCRRFFPPGSAFEIWSEFKTFV
ncbi:Proteasome activator subunit 4 [Vitis vinifera]|uniref:Proteasome activator subunit 4 n=1 Tax=Vitis vinifera TaxID=29760 RepID=A0A438K0C5_VITVI|nr:Proteasome activator subunit 4 [Vitis vinifera]